VLNYYFLTIGCRGLKLSKIFGSSGARGIVNVDLTPLLAVKIGLAVATLSKAKKVLIARDTRVSGLMLENALVSGFLAGGAAVDFLGILPTPVLAYLTKKLRADVGVMITASHNPPQYNGIKVFGSDSAPYNEKSQDEIEKIVKEGSFRLVNWRDINEALAKDAGFHYIEMVKANIKLNREWRVVVDCGCGATYNLAPKILAELGCKVTAINAQPDGFFPARSPEPNAESLKPLTKIVKELDVDLGIAYDGDGDRVAFIDEKGNFVNFDHALAAYASYVSEKTKTGTVVTNVEASMRVEKMVEAYGGKVVRTKVGDIYITEATKWYNAVFGGEPCGAWVHPQFHLCPDGILSSVLLLKALENEEETLSEFISRVPQYPVIRKNIACKNETKHEIVRKVGEKLKATFPDFKAFSNVDGARLTLENGWVLVRASGTEPLIRLTVEGESVKVTKEIMKKSLKLVRELVRG
jgi:phosphoglucosamine mutase